MIGRKLSFGKIVLASMLAIVGLAMTAPRPALADACDALAAQIKDQIEGVKIGETAGGVIYLSHPAVKQATLGCSARNLSNEFYAATDSRKPTPAFVDFVANAAAIVFTIPKSDTLRGTNRCIGRIGIIRGYSISTRFRRLNIRCAGTKTSTTVTISRDKDAN
jgi:hypothetical protein